jgi:hypothetical protein
MPRYSLFTEARQLIEALRGAYGSGQLPRVLLWIMLAEGVLDFYEALEGRSRDRLQRARLLAGAFRQEDVASHAAAWLAMVAFNNSDFSQMHRFIDEALENFEGGPDNFVRARVCMIASMCAALCGRSSEANAWSGAAHSRALKLGDRATIEAIQFNRTAMQLARLRVQACSRPLSTQEIASVEAELASAKSYFMLTQHRPTARLHDLCELRVSCLKGKYAETLAALDRFMQDDRYLRRSFNPDVLALERLFCQTQLKDVIESSRFLKVLDQVDFEELEPDERVIAAWMSLQVASEQRDPALLDSAQARLSFSQHVLEQTYAELNDWLNLFVARQSSAALLRADP